MPIKLSIIILTWNSERFVSNCLNSLIPCLKGIESEIIIIDNGSTDETRNLISKIKDERIQVILQSKNKGVAAARNIGLQIAKGEYILLLDVDTVSNETAIHTLLSFIEQHSDCGICSCKLLNSLGNIQNSSRKIPSVRYKFLNILEAFSEKIKSSSIQKNIININKTQFYREKFDEKQGFEVEYVIGACQMIRREAFKEVGLLDEHIFYGPEDADFCIRLHQKGWKIYFLPYVSIIHEYQQISRKKFFSKMSYIHLKGLLYFFWKHKHV